MSGAAARFGVGTRLVYDGEVVEVIEMMATAAGNEVVLRTKCISVAPATDSLCRVSSSAAGIR